MRSEGVIQPNVAMTAPRGPVIRMPTKVAELTAIGPGVISAMVMRSVNVQRGASVILITMSTRTTLAKLVTQTVVLPFLSHERCNYLLDDAITFFIFIEMIIEALHEESSKQ